jgi:uncharacterized OB-fold protein
MTIPTTSGAHTMSRVPGQHALDHQVVQQFDGAWGVATSTCPTCGDVRYPPRELCVADLTPCEITPLTSNGVVYEAVRVDIAPEGFEPPYWVAYVDHPEGVRLFGTLRWDDAETDPGHGTKVECSVAVVRTDPYEVLGPIYNAV